VEGAVGGSVAAAAESVPAGGSSAAGRVGCGAAEFGGGRLGADPLGVVPGGDQDLAGDLDADAEQVDQVGCGEPDEGGELPVEDLDLLVEGLPPAGQFAPGGLCPGQGG